MGRIRDGRELLLELKIGDKLSATIDGTFVIGTLKAVSGDYVEIEDREGPLIKGTVDPATVRRAEF